MSGWFSCSWGTQLMIFQIIHEGIKLLTMDAYIWWINWKTTSFLKQKINYSIDFGFYFIHGIIFAWFVSMVFCFYFIPQWIGFYFYCFFPSIINHMKARIMWDHIIFFCEQKGFPVRVYVRRLTISLEKGEAYPKGRRISFQYCLWSERCTDIACWCTFHFTS